MVCSLHVVRYWLLVFHTWETRLCVGLSVDVLAATSHTLLRAMLDEDKGEILSPLHDPSLTDVLQWQEICPYDLPGPPPSEVLSYLAVLLPEPHSYTHQVSII